MFLQKFKLRCNELTQAEYRNRRGYNLGLLKQEIQRVPYHTRSHKRLTHTFPSSCRLPPSHSLNILYFPPTHLYSLILPTLCYYPEIYTSLDQSSRLMLYSYRHTLFKVRYLSARSSRMGATGGHLDRVYLELLKGRGTVWAPRGPPSRCIWVQLQKDRQWRWSWVLDLNDLTEKSDCEQSINVIIDRNQLFYHVN